MRVLHLLFELFRYDNTDYFRDRYYRTVFKSRHPVEIRVWKHTLICRNLLVSLWILSGKRGRWRKHLWQYMRTWRSATFVELSKGEGIPRFLLCKLCAKLSEFQLENSLEWSMTKWGRKLCKIWWLWLFSYEFTHSHC